MWKVFVASLQQHPNDEATRLVFADWLEEQGRSVEADILRSCPVPAIVEGQVVELETPCRRPSPRRERVTIDVRRQAHRAGEYGTVGPDLPFTYATRSEWHQWGLMAWRALWEGRRQVLVAPPRYGATPYPER